MRLAALCGLDVPELDLRRAFGRDNYLIRRFDGRREGERLARTPFASGLTMLGAHERDVGRHSYADVAGALRRHGAEPRRDLRELFARMVFNILVTNDDDHLRNHAFLLTPRGWRLSPLYDVVPKPQVGLERALVLGVGPQGRAASLENALAGAHAFGLSPEPAAAIVANLAQIVRGEWSRLFEQAGVGAADRARFATCFRLAEADSAGMRMA